ncbi:unnamed protein product [Ostreobium quekettii]|uniref:isoleucine--tRNA ligase n=1 Tax=Ostreobium quekettii TaxID=121088 RepID=A0A8S1IKI1_9CHLO|nr:unnamed protein product [Ostreobium quekettii]|eukprot:evm.model.scf_772EXC.2 EVM.evm.TU.scf_772EXC.2   scf_772EXC:21295-24357(-)
MPLPRQRMIFRRPMPCGPEPFRVGGLLWAAPRRDVASGAKAKAQDDNPYRETVTLPQTAFSLRANSAVREPEIQRWWAEEGVYGDLWANNPGEVFTLHDGPPYANGDLHMGHAMNKILKDVINRYQLLKGRRARFVPGWDAHGLPIELKVLQSMPRERQLELTPIKLRRKARDFAQKTIDAQREQFKRYGVWADWEEPYVTMQPQYEAAQLGVFGRMVAKGHIYRGRKPVHWSPSSQTALAEAELEYPEGHTSRSCYVALEVVDGNGVIRADGPSSLAIWTTTPWTIPANRAVAVNPEIDYVAAAVSGEGGREGGQIVVAAELVGRLSEKLGKQLTAVSAFKGRDLEGVTYRHPLFPDKVQPVILGGDYITTDAGSGLVHTAPGHGQEDYQVALKYGLEIFTPVDDNGVFTEAAGRFSGMAVLKEGNEAVLAELEQQGLLIKEEPYVHKYPYDWRTKKPVIFRATEQWFASVEGFREEALEAIKSTSWMPASGFNRINGMVEGRTDWCISRQRRWGVPIPAFYDVQTGEPLMTQETIAHIAEVVRKHGTDAWWQMPTEDLLPEGLKERAGSLKKGQDTMDVWFDSGSSWAAVAEKLPGLRYPADLYLEGSDQHRGWFQSSLLTSVAVNGKSPYGAVLTHGFILDESGKKMSKSVGNVLDPKVVIEGGKNLKKEPAYGADVLRLWVAAVDYTNDVIFGPNILKQTAEVYRKIRGTIRFLLGSLSDFDAQQHSVAYQSLPSLDRYILGRFHSVQMELDSAYSSYQFSKVFQGIQRFVIVDLSNFYFDVAKDRLYVQGRSSGSRRACQTAMHHILAGLLSSIAPILPHMAEDAWSCWHSPADGRRHSIFKNGWRAPDDEWRSQWSDDDVLAWEHVFRLREVVTKALEVARENKLIGAPLEAKVLIHMEDPSKIERAVSFGPNANGVDELRYIFITSSVEKTTEDAAGQAPHCVSVDVQGLGRVTVGVSRADGRKCARCWNWSEQVGSDGRHPQLCERCLPVVEEMGFELPPKTVEDSLVGAKS